MASRNPFGKFEVGNKVQRWLDRALVGRNNEDLLDLVEDYSNPSNYAVNQSTADANSTLSLLKEVPAMLKDPVIQSAVGYLMDNSFQPNENQEIFWVTSQYPKLIEELEEFHEQINAQDLILTEGFNLVLWGNLPNRHIFDSHDVLARVVPIPDFTRIVPIQISGKILGYLVDGEYHYPYEFTYAQMKYYKNLGGILKNNYVSMSGQLGDNALDMQSFQNEFVIAPSYLSTAAKPWRYINIIEDALLLNRMDQSNYYRIFSVDVGGAVYSKTAVKTLNFYRNLFKKVRRVNYNASGMAAKGNGNEFEVIVPKNGTAGVDVKDVGGNVDVKALADLDKQYQRLFASLRLQPDQIGFSSDVPNTLGESPVKVWDQRYARLCRTVVYSTLNWLKQTDLVYLRSKGYDVNPKDWSYGTVATSIADEQQRADALKSSLDNLNQLTQRLNALQLESYNKEYLVRSMLGSSLAAIGVDVEQLLKPNNTEVKAINSGLNIRSQSISEVVPIMQDLKIINQDMATAMLGNTQKIAINSSITYKGKVSFDQLASGNVIVPNDTEVDLTSVVQVHNSKTAADMKEDMEMLSSKHERMVTLSTSSVVIVPKDITITVGELNNATIKSVRTMYAKGSDLIISSKEDLITYLGLKLQEISHCVVADYIEVKV